MSLTRRQCLKLGVLGGAAAFLPVATAVAVSRKNATAAGPVIPSFVQDLTIPPVLQPVRSDATTDYYQMTQQEAQVEILPGLKTTIWGYNGSFPGADDRGAPRPASGGHGDEQAALAGRDESRLRLR